MYHHSHGLSLDVEALSGICGSVSIACWIVVFTPQVIENFRRGSADGLSLVFIAIWLLGDVFNIVGTVLQGVIPTMTILAVYYTFADAVLLGQCLYYRGFTPSDAQPSSNEDTIADEANEESPLLSDANTRGRSSSRPAVADAELSLSKHSTSTLRTILFNTTALILVCAAGVAGWAVSMGSARSKYPQQGQDTSTITTMESEAVRFDLWGQVFGYLSAVLYLGSRVPQLLLNYRRKSTEGISILFFLFACVGNLTYVLSIFAYEPQCAKPARAYGGSQCEQGEWEREYKKYILVNTSWLIGSAGTLLLDCMIFVQFWIYRKSGK
ncbi:MAG: hypothetical protein Q9185_003094 [Variospora sp. 1 TL-2023]